MFAHIIKEPEALTFTPVFKVPTYTIKHEVHKNQLFRDNHSVSYYCSAIIMGVSLRVMCSLMLINLV